MNYTQAMAYLEDSNRYGSVLGLDSMKALLDRLGNPQDRLKFVHIAGTNGKGSTAAFIASMLATAGYRVGRYISPAVFGYKEKIQISDKNQAKDSNQTLMNLPFVTRYIKENNIAEYVDCIKKACDDMTALGMPHPTIFEMETAMAMIHFRNEKCDLVVLEVGLGGRLDATNIITNTECAVITSISMDHMHILGNTLELIAAEKAGIIKHDIEVISYKQELEAEKVIRKVCIENQARLTEANFNHIM
jgi:dihydrofolate synthase/folylpolyglutamate synthase